MTKQATNYLLVQLESLGYIERRPQRGSNHRLVYLTRRGWDAAETMWAAMRSLEAEWAELLGKGRFEGFLETLRELSSHGRSEEPSDDAPKPGSKKKPRR